MTNMSCCGLKAIVTCPHGKEGLAEVEVLDLLVPYDHRADVRRSKFRGVLLVYSKSLSPWDVWRIVMEGPTAFIHRVIPVEMCVKTDLASIVDAGLSLFLEKLSKLKGSRGDTTYFKVVCMRRGRLVSSSLEVVRALGEAIVKATNAKVSLTRPDLIVWVEVVGELTGVSVIPSGTPIRKGRRSLKQ